MRKPVRTHLPAFAALAGLVALCTIGSAPAGATGAVGGGFVFMHGPGSVYAASNDTVTSVTTANGTATYSVEVVNRGTSLAQFNLRLNQSLPGDTLTLASGATNITDVAKAPRGYFTKLLAPGKSEVLSLKDKTPGSATMTDRFTGQVVLRDTDGGFLGEASYETGIRATTGQFATDLYTSTPGSPAVISDQTGFSSDTAAEAMKPAGHETFTVKAQNDSLTPTQLRVGFSEFEPCGQSVNPVFPAVVKVGTTNITTAASNGTYMTPLLAHAHSTTLSVTVTYPPVPPVNCGSDQLAIVVFSPNDTAAEASLLANLAA
jgi:hypothetical protein